MIIIFKDCYFSSYARNAFWATILYKQQGSEKPPLLFPESEGIPPDNPEEGEDEAGQHDEPVRQVHPDRQGCGSGWVLSGSATFQKKTGPDSNFEKKSDPDPTL